MIEDFLSVSSEYLPYVVIGYLLALRGGLPGRGIDRTHLPVQPREPDRTDG